MSEMKKITGIISEELDEALNQSAKNQNKKKMPYIGEILEKYLKEEKLETDEISKTDKKEKPVSKKK